jgi:hypothetical protein
MRCGWSIAFDLKSEEPAGPGLNPTPPPFIQKTTNRFVEQRKYSETAE